MRYVLSAKELTELVKEVGSEVSRMGLNKFTEHQVIEHQEEMKDIIHDVLQGRGIAWCDDE